VNPRRFSPGRPLGGIQFDGEARDLSHPCAGGIGTTIDGLRRPAESGSPDGQWIAFISQPKAVAVDHRLLFGGERVAVSGAGSGRVPSKHSRRKRCKGARRFPSWSPDSKEIRFGELRWRDPSLWTFRMADGNSRSASKDHRQPPSRCGCSRGTRRGCTTSSRASTVISRSGCSRWTQRNAPTEPLCEAAVSPNFGSSRWAFSFRPREALSVQRHVGRKAAAGPEDEERRGR